MFPSKLRPGMVNRAIQSAMKPSWIGARTLGHPYPNWERNPVGFLWWPPALLVRHVLGIDQMRTHTLAPQRPCQGCVQERKRPRLGLYRKIQGEENGSKRWKQVFSINMRYNLLSLNHVKLIVSFTNQLIGMIMGSTAQP